MNITSPLRSALTLMEDVRKVIEAATEPDIDALRDLSEAIGIVTAVADTYDETDDGSMGLEKRLATDQKAGKELIESYREAEKKAKYDEPKA